MDEKLTETSRWSRIVCASCQQSTKYYCAKCFVPVGVPSDVSVPLLTLPVKLHIWFQDKLKKSTAPHAKVLAHNDVEIINWPLSEQHQQSLKYHRDEVLVVYPTYDAEVLPEMTCQDLEQVTTLVFIDCPWQKAPVILQDPKLVGLRRVKLASPPTQSKFWRYHQAGAGCVSTIEAIQLMLKDYVNAMNTAGLALRQGSETTNLDHILFFFDMLYSHIKEYYLQNTTFTKLRSLPMDETEKERQRHLHNQKEAGKKRKLELKRERWRQYEEALQKGEITKVPRQNDRCYNCKEPGHEAKACPSPCKYCKQSGHCCGECSMKQVRQEITSQQQTRITKAI